MMLCVQSLIIVFRYLFACLLFSFPLSGRKGEIRFHDSVKEAGGRVVYPNINRALKVIGNLTQHFSQPQFAGTVVGIELVNEAFVTIPIEIVKDYYLQYVHNIQFKPCEICAFH